MQKKNRHPILRYEIPLAFPDFVWYSLNIPQNLFLGGKNMKKLTRLIAILVVLVIIAAAAFIFVPKLAHTCDNCGKFFVGTGYKANIVSNAITSLSGEESKLLCKDCAAKEHALAIAAGKSLKDFQLPLFEQSEEK